MISIKNKTKFIRTFHLPVPCIGAGVTAGTSVEQHRQVIGPDGKTRYKPRKRVMPGVLTILPGEQLDDLPDQVLKSPELAKALANPQDKLVRVAPPTVTNPPVLRRPRKVAAPRGED